MASSGARGFTRLINATRYSWQGFVACYRHEEAFRQEIWAALVLVPLALWLGSDALERVALIGSVLLVLVVELLNSGIEAVTDRVGEEHHELARRAKDMGSAAVMTSLLIWALVWLAVLLG
jgi:diacylglycerol kinase (ATP)